MTTINYKTTKELTEEQLLYCYYFLKSRKIKLPFIIYKYFLVLFDIFNNFEHIYKLKNNIVYNSNDIIIRPKCNIFKSIKYYIHFLFIKNNKLEHIGNRFACYVFESDQDIKKFQDHFIKIHNKNFMEPICLNK